MDIVKKATETATEPLHWVRRYPWAAALFALVIAILIFRKSEGIRTSINKGVAEDSTFYKSIAWAFGVPVPAAKA